MHIKKNNLFVLIINCWALLTLCLIILTNCSHGKITILSWVNYSVYFLLFIMAFFIFIRDKFTREIFFLLSAFFLLYGISIIHNFIGEQYLFGTDLLKKYIIAYKKIALNFVQLLILTQIALRYIQKKRSPYKVLAQSILLTVLTIYGVFFKFINNPNYLNRSFAFEKMQIAILMINLIMLVWILIYAIFLYKYDHPNGEFVGLIIAAFFLYVTMDVIDTLFAYQGNNNFLVSQLNLIVNLFIFGVVLMRKLIYTYSPFGSFYENLIFNNTACGIKVKRRGRRNTYLWKKLHHCFFNKNCMLIIKVSLVLVSINFMSVSTHFRINVFTVFLCSLLLLVYYNNLNKKRHKKGDFIS